LADAVDPSGGAKRSFRGSPRLIGSIVGAGLAVVLLSLSGFAIWAAVSTAQAVHGARLASQQHHAIDEARFQVEAEASLEREYRPLPSAQLRNAHRLAGLAFVQALQPLFVSGEAADKRLAQDLVDVHGRYLAVATQLFDALDAGDKARIAALDEQILPLRARLETQTTQEASLEGVEAEKELVSADQTVRWLQEVTPIVFGLGLLMVAIFLLVFGSYRRNEAARQREAQAATEMRVAAEAEQRALQRSEERFRSLVQYAADLITVVDTDGVILYQSDSSSRVLGYLADETVGKSIFDFTVPEDVLKIKSFLAAALRKPGQAISGEVRARRRDGTALPVETIGTALIDNPSVGGILLTSRDLTERKVFEKKLRHQALHDALTGLPNRLLFMDRVAHGLARSRRNRDLLAVLFLDLDDFKLVNDSFGHKAGDTLLQAIAHRIEGALRPGDTVARLGGDEFAVLLESLHQTNDVAQVTDRIAEQLKEPVTIDGRLIVPSTSIGIALTTAGEGIAEDLLRNADVAMYAAKAAGKARSAFFDERMMTLTWERMALELDLRRALAQNEFRVSYQPIVDLTSRRVTEVEALVRWQHRERGLLEPADFLAVAESTGMIVPIGHWVLKQACEQLRAWQEAYGGRAPSRVCVNLSARQFQQPRLVEEIEAVLREARLEPTALTLEITETVMMQDAEGARAVLNQLRGLGIKTAVDDFGTGYSSLTYLRQFPIDVLKIDQSFITRLGIDSENTAIVGAVVSLAKTLNLEVIGEGIEDGRQATALQSMGCDLGQGFYFAKPLGADEVAELLQPEKPERLTA
jgi:diguanylate cyclase (GGDEF)-like protein/PAS domain S-box-containing protein